ncbi:MAG: WbqC family protein [Nitrospira sp.]
MQPTYLPWSGYFGLMHAVDLFIFLDSVQFTRRSWQQRNQIKTANGPQWLTVPVLVKGKRDQLISEVEIDKAADFSMSHRRSIEWNYRKAPYFEAHASALLPLLNPRNNQLADLTMGLILHIKNALGVRTRILRSSELRGIGHKADLLASLCQQVGATEYVSPPGSKEYLEASDAFAKIGVPVRYFQFIHPEYPQLFGEFVPYMSCIDMLFNCGDKSLSLIEGGLR